MHIRRHCVFKQCSMKLTCHVLLHANCAGFTNQMAETAKADNAASIREASALPLLPSRPPSLSLDKPSTRGDGPSTRVDRPSTCVDRFSARGLTPNLVFCFLLCFIRTPLTPSRKRTVPISSANLPPCSKPWPWKPLRTARTRYSSMGSSSSSSSSSSSRS